MSKLVLERISCPACGSPINLENHVLGKQVHCGACGSGFLLCGHVCPYCSTYHQEEATFCRQCGAGLTRRCRKCDLLNWIGDEYCVDCGAALDIFEVISQQHTQDTKTRLYEQRETARALRAAEETAGEARRARMLEQERLRQAEIQRKLQARQEQERKMMQRLIVFSVAAAIIVILMIIFVIF